MKIQISIFFIFLCSFSAFSQIDTNKIIQYAHTIDSLIINAKLNDSVSKYYKFVYKAENEYMKQNYKEAAIHYEKAFRYLKHPFAKDLFNAIECEQKSYYNINNLKNYIYLLFIKWETNKPYKYSEGLQIKDSIEIVKMIDTIKLCIDTVLRDSISLMLQIDQSVRHGLNYPLSEKDKNLLDSIDSINYNNLLNIIVKNPVFTEELIGSRAWSDVYTILGHNNNELEIYIKLHNLVINGQIDARKYSRMLDVYAYKIELKYKFGEDSYGRQFDNLENIKDNVYMFIPQTYKGRKTINKYRKQLYLETIKDFHKKRIWVFRTGIYLYSMTAMIDKEDAFMKIIKENKWENMKVKVYYKNKEDEKRLKAAAKEYYKNNSIKP